MNTIITDIDDVVLSFTSAFVRWMAGRGIIPVIPKENATDYNDLYGFDVSDAVIEFSESADMGKLGSYANADEVIPYLRELGYRFVGVTACHDASISKDLRIKNILEICGFEFDDVIFVGFCGSKLEALAALPSAVFIDDIPSHVRSGIEAGHEAILMDSGFHTEDTSDLRRVDSWHQIKDIVLGR